MRPGNDRNRQNFAARQPQRLDCGEAFEANGFGVDTQELAAEPRSVQISHPDFPRPVVRQSRPVHFLHVLVGQSSSAVGAAENQLPRRGMDGGHVPVEDPAVAEMGTRASAIGEIGVVAIPTGDPQMFQPHIAPFVRQADARQNPRRADAGGLVRL